MDNKTRCIVLRTVKVGDNRIIADLLCRECGRLSVALPVGRRSTSRSLFQPLTVLEIDYAISQSQQLARIKDARIAMTYVSLPFDGIKLSLAFFVAEFLSFCTRDLHCDPNLYDFVEQNLLWLDTSDIGMANFHLMFMIRMARFLGFYPDTTSFFPGAFFDLREGVFCQHAPCHSDFLKQEDAGRMMLLMRMMPANLHLFRLSRADRNRITDFCLRFYRLHIPSFGEMKTLDVLRTL